MRKIFINARINKTNLLTGAELRNVALISFDSQTIIATNQVDPQNPTAGIDPFKEALNTIDAGAPESAITNLPSTTHNTEFVVTWSGDDNAGGSGISFYDIYVAQDGEAYDRWLNRPTAGSEVYVGVPGHTYAFYSVATDNVGLREATPIMAQATITLLVNEPPNNIVLSATSISEVAALGTAIGVLASSDSNPDSTFSYQILPGPHADLFEGNQLRVAATLDFETIPVPSITIRSTDEHGLFLDKAFVVHVLNANEPATSITLSADAILENAPGAVMGSLTVIDPESVDSHILSTNDSRFEIIGRELRLKVGQALNYEAGAAVVVQITAVDNGIPPRSLTQSLTINVGNVNESPTAITLSRSKAFARIPGAWIAAVTVSDPDFSSTHSFVLSDSRFAISGGHLYLKPDQSLNHLTEPTIAIDVTASDNGSSPLSVQRSFVLTVEPEPTDWQFAYQWKTRVHDVDADGLVTPLDALLIINRINTNGTSSLPSEIGGTRPPYFFDVSGDGFLTPYDAVLVINYLNALGNAEAAPMDAAQEALSFPLFDIPASELNREAITDKTINAPLDYSFWDLPEASALQLPLMPLPPFVDIWSTIARSEREESDWWQATEDGESADFWELTGAIAVDRRVVRNRDFT